MFRKVGEKVIDTHPSRNEKCNFGVKIFIGTMLE